MLREVLHHLAGCAAQAADPGGVWRTWPFGRGDEGFWPSALRVVFILVMFLLIAFFLRLLFGPKGIWRDREVDAEYEQMRAQKLEQLDELYRQGRITKEQYEWRKDRL